MMITYLVAGRRLRENRKHARDTHHSLVIYCIRILQRNRTNRTWVCVYLFITYLCTYY